MDFAPPPVATEITAGQLNRFLCKVGTFDPALANEFKAGGVAGQLNSDGANDGLGTNIPSLISAFASAPYFHSGAAQTLDETLENVSHRKLGTGADTLSTVTDRAKVVKFLKSIDLTTPTFPEKTMNEAKTLCLP